MKLSILIPILGILLIISSAIGCNTKNKKRVETIKKTIVKEIDTCGPWYSENGNDIRDAKGSDLDFKIGCGTCHSNGSTRTIIELPTLEEISRIDSLKLRDFIFITKHKGYFKKEPVLAHKIKTLDSLSDCDRKNLIHYLKNQSRIIVHALSVPNKSTDTVILK